MDKEVKKLIKALGILSTVGLSMALAIGIGAFVGHYLDEKLGTAPWLLLVFLGLGIAAAFRNLYRMTRKAKDL